MFLFLGHTLTFDLGPSVSKANVGQTLEILEIVLVSVEERFFLLGGGRHKMLLTPVTEYPVAVWLLHMLLTVRAALTINNMCTVVMGLD